MNEALELLIIALAAVLIMLALAWYAPGIQF